MFRRAPFGRLRAGILARAAALQNSRNSRLFPAQIADFRSRPLVESNGTAGDHERAAERRRFPRISSLLLGGMLATFVLWNERAEEWKKRFRLHFLSHFPVLLPAAASKEADEEADGEKPPSECDVFDAETAPKKRKKKVGFRERRIMEYENRIRMYSSPDKIFRYFATLKVQHEDGNYEVFMTPEDFVRSLTPGVMQPRRWGLDKFKVYTPGAAVPYTSNSTIFYWMGRDGLINFTDYLFLMTLLSTSPSDIHLAFYVYDLNGDGQLDKEEFERVQELLLQHSFVGQKHPTAVSTLRRSSSSALVKHFFGEDGRQKLDVQRFLKFQKDLHRDILLIEFERRDPETMPHGIISEIAFADLLLIHAALPEKRKAKMMKRVKRAYAKIPNKPGVSFDEVNDYFLFLYQIDKVDLALHFYKLAGQPLDRELLQKVAKKVAGVRLTDVVVDIVVTMFDENGDGKLSNSEFVSVMKKRMNRGLERPKDTGLFRLMDAAIECTKKQFFNLLFTPK
ncbi:Calcium uptake protein 1, mitochondrial [Aphelenchoides fujianensis]|nr:Calcium uptake protein 1, mitochondrial [Aphelenchoides fujianensis]